MEGGGKGRSPGGWWVAEEGGAKRDAVEVLCDARELNDVVGDAAWADALVGASAVSSGARFGVRGGLHIPEVGAQWDDRGGRDVSGGRFGLVLVPFGPEGLVVIGAGRSTVRLR